MKSYLACGALALLAALPGAVQTARTSAQPQQTREGEIQELRQQLNALSQRLAVLEASEQPTAPLTPTAPAPVLAATPATAAPPAPANAPPAAALTASTPPPSKTGYPSFLHGTTLNLLIDGYYEYNFNQPVGRVNLLRAYDVTSNSFNLAQVDFVVERLPTTEQRVGGRVDLMFGQATETLQGSSANEQRPQVWRNLYQAYGSYLAPLGHGLHLDFGKFASSLGDEGNYPQDQVAYTRSYSFLYLPFYHMGLRANYDINPRVNVAYWLVNGANDTEDLNGFKSQAFLFTVKPAKSISWKINYYFGQEARDVPTTLNPGLPTMPVQPGLPLANITPAPNGREHIFNTYATWQATPKFTLTGEADFVLNRTLPEQQPSRVALGGFIAQYALPHGWFLGARSEYVDDRGGLFSTQTQALKEATAVIYRTLAPGFQVKAEYRHDWSNQPFFFSDTPGSPKHAQSTTALGLLYWWGGKQGSW